MQIVAIIPTLSSSSLMIKSCIASLVKAVDAAQNINPDFSLRIVITENQVTEAEVLTTRNQTKNQGPVALEVLQSPVNKGFTGGVNDGIWYANETYHPDWFLVINDDVKVDRDFFSILSSLLSSSVAALSLAVKRLDGTLESQGLRYFKTGIAFPYVPNGSSEKNYSLTSLIPIITQQPLLCGTCFLVSQQAVQQQWQKLGMFFNPLFFAYAEDLDLSLRFHRDQLPIIHVDKSLVTHLGSQTAKRGSYFQLFHGLRNLLWVVILQWSPTQIIFNLPWLVIGQLFAIGLSLKKRHWLLYAHIMVSTVKHWPSLMYLRRKYETNLTLPGCV